jgi:hypothetical protein
MLNKLHLDPSAFNSLIESINKFIISLRLSSERTILSCYTAEKLSNGREGLRAQLEVDILKTVTAAPIPPPYTPESYPKSPIKTDPQSVDSKYTPIVETEIIDSSGKNRYRRVGGNTGSRDSDTEYSNTGYLDTANPGVSDTDIITHDGTHIPANLNTFSRESFYPEISVSSPPSTTPIPLTLNTDQNILEKNDKTNSLSKIDNGINIKNDVVAMDNKYDIDIKEILINEKNKKFKKKYRAGTDGVLWESSPDLMGNIYNNLDMDNNKLNSVDFNYNNYIDQKNLHMNKFNVNDKSMKKNKKILSVSSLTRTIGCEKLLLSIYYHIPSLRENIIETLFLNNIKTINKNGKNGKNEKKKIRKKDIVNDVGDRDDGDITWHGEGGLYMYVYIFISV